MPMVCGQCREVYERRIECPSCGVRLHFESNVGTKSARDAAWQNQPIGRIAIGLLLAQGLAYGLRLFCDASTLFAEDTNDQQSAILSIVVLQGVQAFCLLASGILTGAGQRQGAILGAMVGLFNSLVFMTVRQFTGETMTEVEIYGQPILHTAVGAAGGLIGSVIWRPLPTLTLALPLAPKKGKRINRIQGGMFDGPIAWLRVMVGMAASVVGVVSAALVLNWVLDASAGQMKITSNFQSRLITWEISGLAVLLGSGIAGFGTFNGPKQGLCVGIGSSLILLGLHFIEPKTVLEETLLMTFCVMALAVAGGWLSSKLFPPVAPARPKIPVY
jgi:hypothetical protein